MSDTQPRTYWTPGTVLPESATDSLREHPTALKHHHVVASAVFTGHGHSGLILTQYNGDEWAIWFVDVYGNPALRVLDDVKRRGPEVQERVRAIFAERVAALLGPDDDDVADAGTGHGAYEYRSGN